MGVHGLWSLLEPAGKPITLEALENKVLAIDISIWLNQAVKGIRGESGGAVSNAHLLGLFHRICKLLFYRIKPIFVFDGRPPQLKRETLQRRRLRKSQVSKQSEASRAKLINNYIRSRAISHQLQTQSTKVAKALEQGREGLSALLNERSKSGASAAATAADKDIFELPPVIPGADQDDSSDSEREDVLCRMNIDGKTDIHAVDLDDDRFKSLSTHQKAELLMELRERRKQSSWAKIHEMPKEASEFSGFQLERLKKRSALHKCLDEVGSQASQDSSEMFHDHKLFVGDKDGIRRQKLKIVGKDFIYLARQESPRPGQSSSADADDDDGGGGGDSEEEIELQLAQFIELESSGRTQATLEGGSDEGEEEVVILEPSEGCRRSARKGGKMQVVDIKEEEADVEEDCESGAKESSSSSDEADDDFVEVPLDQKALVDDEDDLFADVFETVESHETLENILQEGGKKAADARALKTKQVSAKEKDTASPSDSDTSLPKISADISSAMKGQNHLFLKIASKWVPESQPEPSKVSAPEKKSTIENSSFAMKVQQDLDDLLVEMKGAESEARLTNAKKPWTTERQDEHFSTRKTWPADSTATATTSAETRLLSELGVSVADKETYESALLAPSEEGGRREQTQKLSVPVPAAEVYASSAPGFVRSKRSKAIEVEGFDDHYLGRNDDLDNEIMRKLDSNDSAEAMLNRAELLKIQKQLACDQQQLVAERSRIDRQAATITDQMYKDCQELLQLFGLPWIVAPTEAEAECAFLDIIGLSHGTITDDSDIWVFGGQTVYKNFFNQGKHCEQFRAQDIADSFGLSREKMIMLALLTGSDYTDGVENVGPVTAMEILSEFPSGHGVEPLRQFQEWWKKEGVGCTTGGETRGYSRTREKLKKLKLPESFPSQTIADAYLKPEVDNSTEAFFWSVPNFVEITDFAHDTFGWTRQKIDEVIKPVIRKIKEKKSQTRIDYYFHQKGQTGVKMLQSSKRMQNAIGKVLGSSPPKTSQRPEAKKSSTAPKKQKLVQQHPVQGPSTSTVAGPEPENSRQAEEKRKLEARKRAIDQYHRSKAIKMSKKRKRVTARQKTSIVQPEHNLSESDSS